MPSLSPASPTCVRAAWGRGPSQGRVQGEAIPAPPRPFILDGGPARFAQALQPDSVFVVRAAVMSFEEEGPTVDSLRVELTEWMARVVPACRLVVPAGSSPAIAVGRVR